MDQVIQVVQAIGPHGGFQAESMLFDTRQLAMTAAAELWAAGKRIEFICPRCGNWESQHNSHPWACGGADFERREREGGE